MDLISRKAAIEAIKDPVVKGFAMYGLKSVPSVPAVPLDKLCEWLSENTLNIPCSSCPNFSNEYCTVIGYASKPCPQTADDWRKAITKYMEEQDVDNI